jgi:hypothetical protein
LVSLIVSSKENWQKQKKRLSRVGSSLLSTGDVAASTADDIALRVALAGVLGKTSIDGLRLDGGLETINTTSALVGAISQLSWRLALDGLAETSVDVLGGGAVDGVLSRDGAGAISTGVGLEGAEETVSTKLYEMLKREKILPLRRSGASRKGLGVELRDSIIADELSGLVTRLGEGLVSRSRGVETIRVGVGSSVNVTGGHSDWCEGWIGFGLV